MATQQQYQAAFAAAWQEIQHRLAQLGPMEQSMARMALHGDMIRAITNKAVDAALAASPSPQPAPAKPPVVTDAKD